MLIRLTGQTGQFDLIPNEFTVTDGTRLIFADVTSASQFLVQFRYDSLAMGRLEDLHDHIRPVGKVKRYINEDTLLKQLAAALTCLSGGRVAVIEREQDEAPPRWRGADALSTALKPVAPISRPITERERQRWEESFNTKPVPEQKYKVVIEVAGKQLESLKGSRLDLRRLLNGDDYTRGIYFHRDTSQDAHRSVLQSDNVPNQPRQLYYILGTDCIPLCMNVTPVAREAEAAQWANVLIPLLPVARMAASHEHRVLPPGWLYVYLNGYIWREAQVGRNAGALRHVEYDRHPGKHQRPAEGDSFELLVVPHKLNGVTQIVQIAYSRQQWTWTQLCNAGGINPDDPCFLPRQKQRWANIPVDPAFQQAHLTTLDFSAYNQGFNTAGKHSDQGPTISPIASAPEVMYEPGPPLAARDRLAKFRHLNIPVVGLPVAPVEPLVIAYLEADGQQGIPTNYCVTCQGGLRYEGELDPQGQAVIPDIIEGTVSIEFGDPASLDQLHQQRDKQRKALSNTLHAMIGEVEALAVHQNRQLAEEGLITTGFIYTGAFLTGLYQSGQGLVTSAQELVTATGSVILQIQIANHNAMNALMQGDMEKAKHAYTPLTSQGEAAIDAAEDSFETLSLLLGDADSRKLLMDFPKHYLGAHSSVEQTRMAGVLAFDILLVLAGAVAGGALVAIKGSRYFTEANQLFKQLADTLKTIKHKKTVQGHTDQKRIEARVDEEKTTATVAEYGYDGGGGVPGSNGTANSALHARHVDELATLNRQDLIDELSQNGIRHTPENIIDIRKTQDGKIVFLETGNRQAGLEHITIRHEEDFANVGIHADQIPDAVMTAITQGKVIGYQGKNQGRTIYDVVFNDTRHRISVTISDNGFIVGANPQSKLLPYVSE